MDISEEELNQEYKNAIQGGCGGSSNSSNSNYQAFQHQTIQGFSSSQDLSAISLPPLFQTSSDTSSSSLPYLSSQPSLSNSHSAFIKDSDSTFFTSSESLGFKDQLLLFNNANVSTNSAFSFPITSNMMMMNSGNMKLNAMAMVEKEEGKTNGSESSENESCYDEVPRNSRLWNWIGESLNGMSSRSSSSEMKMATAKDFNEKIN